MVNDPFAVLDLPANASAEAIRRRYLELVKKFPPEHFPERFTAVRAAYDALKDSNELLRRRLFENGRGETLESLIEEMACRSSRRRVSLETMLQTLRQRH